MSQNKKEKLREILDSKVEIDNSDAGDDDGDIEKFN
jgi:hypothetical protein